MLLQLANDSHIRSDFFTLAIKVASHVDIIEVGTPALLAHGMELVRETKAAFPGHKVLADAKIVDGGYLEAAMAFQSGADIVTVLAFAPVKTIQETVKAADEFGGQIMLDTLAIKSIEEFVSKAAPLSPDYVCLHTSADLSDVGEDSHLTGYAEKMGTLRRILPHTMIAVAGGISLDNLPVLLSLRPDVVIAGRSISRAENPVEAAATMKKRMAGSI